MRRAAGLALALALLLVAAASGADGPALVARIQVPATSQPCAAAAGGRFVWVSGFGSSSLLKIDPRTNAVVGHTTIGGGACGLGAGAGSLWIEDTSSGTVSRVSIKTAKRIAAIQVGAQPYDATFAYGSAWATVYGGGSLVRIDPKRNRVVKRFDLPLAIGVVGAFGSIWATGADGVIRIDPATDRVVARIPLDSAGWTAAGAGAVWITSPTGLSRIDPAANTITSTIALPAPLGDPAVVGGSVWVPRIRANRIAIVDAAAGAVSETVKAGSGPFVVTEIKGEAWVPSWHGADVRRYAP
jgi:DNA-binding beta-propeller fold protein YncE